VTDDDNDDISTRNHTNIHSFILSNAVLTAHLSIACYIILPLDQSRIILNPRTKIISYHQKIINIWLLHCRTNFARVWELKPPTGIWYCVVWYTCVNALDATAHNQVPGQDTINSTSIPFFFSFCPHKSRKTSTIPAFCHCTSHPSVHATSGTMCPIQMTSICSNTTGTSSNLEQNLLQTVETHTWSIYGNSRNHLSIGVIRVERQWITTAHLQCDCLCWGNGLEHAHHVVMCETQHTRLIDIHQHIT